MLRSQKLRCRIEMINSGVTWPSGLLHSAPLLLHHYCVKLQFKGKKWSPATSYVHHPVLNIFSLVHVSSSEEFLVRFYEQTGERRAEPNESTQRVTVCLQKKKNERKIPSETHLRIICLTSDPCGRTCLEARHRIPSRAWRHHCCGLLLLLLLLNELTGRRLLCDKKL